MGNTLLLISADSQVGREEVRRGVSPRKDYLVLADELDADILDLRAVRAHPVARRLDRLLRRGAGHVWLARQMVSDYDTVFSDGEHIGLPLGTLLARRRHRCRHVMIGHGLSSWRKRRLAGWARDGIDALVVHCARQLDFAISRLRFDPGQVYLLPYQVDVDFWRPRQASEELLIISCGREQRDFPTFVEAVRGLPVGVSIAVDSPWSRDRNRLGRRPLPANVSAGRHSYEELRVLYGQARFVVVPLVEGDYPAGIATILEAMAMGKAVIVSRTRGQRETVVGPVWSSDQAFWPAQGPGPEDSNGIYVPTGDVGALRSAIVYLLERPELANVLGSNARRLVEEQLNLPKFIARLAQVIDPSRAQTGPINAGVS